MLGLFVDAPDVLAENADGQQLQPAEKQHGHGQRRPARDEPGSSRQLVDSKGDHQRQAGGREQQAGVRRQPQRLTRKAGDAVERKLHHLSSIGILRLAAVPAIPVVQHGRLVVADPRDQASHEPALLLQALQIVDHAPRHQPEVAGVHRNVDRRHAADEAIEQRRRRALEPGLAVARAALGVDDVEALAVFFVERRDQLGRILQVGVHDHDGRAAAHVDAGGNRDLMAEVSAEVHRLDVTDRRSPDRECAPTSGRGCRR